jgi:hypothetical protein
MIKLIPPVNFYSHENIQNIFGTKLVDFLNYRIDYNSISSCRKSCEIVICTTSYESHTFFMNLQLSKYSPLQKNPLRTSNFL